MRKFVYSREIVLNIARIREVNSTEIDSNFTARDYVLLQRQAANNQTNFHNFKHAIEFTYSDFPCHLKVNRDKLALIRVDGSRIRNEKVADSKISGYVWTGPNWCSLIVWFKFCRSELSQMRTHAATRLLALILSLRYGTRIQTRLSSIRATDRSDKILS